MIGLIDYGAGNLHSAHNALTRIGASCQLVRSPADLTGVDRLVLPGVGACVDCVNQLKEQDLWSPLRDWLEADKPYFGICNRLPDPLRSQRRIRRCRWLRNLGRQGYPIPSQ